MFSLRNKKVDWIKWMIDVWFMMPSLKTLICEDMGIQSLGFLFQNNSWYKLMTAGFWISWICWISLPTTSANLKCLYHNFKLILTIELQDKKFEGLRNFQKLVIVVALYRYSIRNLNLNPLLCLDKQNDKNLLTLVPHFPTLLAGPTLCLQLLR